MSVLNLFKKGRRYSVLIVPEGDDRTFNFRFNAAVLRGLCVFGVLGVAGVIGITVNFSRVVRIAHKVERLERENRFLRRENAKVVELQQSLYEMKEIDHRLRKIAGVRIESGSRSPGGSLPASGGRLWQTAQKMEVGAPRDMLEARSFEETEDPIFGISEEGLRTTPNLWPVQGWVSAEFNLSVGPLGRRHTGIDIAAPSDTPVKAAADGVVTFVGWTHDLGNLIMIQHDVSFSTRYGHNSRVLVGQGERVRKGQTVAFVGNSGRSSAPHLHFEIWKDGSPVNPRQYLLE